MTAEMARSLTDSGLISAIVIERKVLEILKSNSDIVKDTEIKFQTDKVNMLMEESFVRYRILVAKFVND